MQRGASPRPGDVGVVSERSEAEPRLDPFDLGSLGFPTKVVTGAGGWEARRELAVVKRWAMWGSFSVLCPFLEGFRVSLMMAQLVGVGGIFTFPWIP